MKFIVSTAYCLLATQPMTIASTVDMSALTEPTQGTEQTLSASELSIQRIVNDIMMDQGKCGKYTVHNLDAVAGLIQGLNGERNELTKFIHPAEIISSLALSQLSNEDRSTLFSRLPNLPSDIKESETPLVMQVFLFAASAFGKDTAPVYVYATRPAEKNEPVNTMWEDELSALGEKVAELEKKFGYIRAIDMSLDIEVAQTEYNITALSGPIFKSLFPTLVDYYKFFADFGVLEMQNSLGSILLENSEDRECLDGALKYLKMAADQGHKNAQHNYGTALGEAGFSEDAFFYFQIAANHGNMVAQHNCGVALLNGIGVARDTKRAFKYFRLAALSGLKDAQVNCVRMLKNNELDSEDARTAFHDYKLMAEQGYIDAQFEIGSILDNGLKSISVEHFEIGSIVRYGPDIISVDHIEAFKYYKMAADQGHAAAQYNCGISLVNGEGISENKIEAFRYFQLAANQGYVDAQHSCGVMLYNGEGIDVNLPEAFRYFKMVADQGCMYSQYRYGTLLLNENGPQQNNTQALKYFKLAADQGHSESQFKCGEILNNGDGVERNLPEALQYYRRAATQGQIPAKWKMHDLMPETWDMPTEPRP